MTQHYNSLALAQGRTWRRNRNTIRYQTAARSLGPITNTLLIAVMLCILGLVYLTQITKNSSYGYRKHELQTRIDELTAEKQSLEVESARLQAADRIQNSDVAKRLTAPAQTSHIEQ